MRRLRPVLFAPILAAATVWFPQRDASAQATAVQADPGLALLESELVRLAPLAGGRMGIGAIHLETGRAVYLNGDEPFPMASSFKVPVAVQLLTRVDRGEIRLDSMVALRPSDLHPGSGTLTQLFDDPGVVLSLRNLLELMLLISDNSATDIVLRLAGGGARVTERMRAIGIEGVRVDRPTIELIADWAGVTGLPADSGVTMDRYRELARSVTPEQRRAAAEAFDRDPRDTATPEGMALLLRKVWDGSSGLSPGSRDLLLDIMTRSTTGAGRIKGMLPPDVTVAHKTGTIGGTTNDVGIITLPEDRGHVVTAVFVKESERPVEQREHAIAQVSRAIYDYFLFR